MNDALCPAVRVPRRGVYMCEHGTGRERRRRYVGRWTAGELNSRGWTVFAQRGSGWTLWAKPYALAEWREKPCRTL